MDEIKEEIERIAAFYTKHPEKEGLKAAILKVVEDAKEEGASDLLKKLHELKQSKK